ARNAGGLRLFQAGPRLRDRGGRLAQRALDRQTRDRFLVGGLLRRCLGALPTIERVGEREAIVALEDGFAGGVQCFFGGGEFLPRVVAGAGRPRGVDRLLRLLDF